MNRGLAALVVVQAAVIAYLLMQGREPGARDTTEREGVHAPAPTAPAARTVEGVEPESPAPRPNQEPETGVLHGRLIAEDGATLPQRRVWLRVEAPGGPRFHTTPQEGGYYAIAGVPPGTYDLRIESPTFHDIRTSVEVAAGGTRRDFTLTRALALQIRVVTPEGEPVGKHAPAPHGIGAVATREPLATLPMTELRGHRRYGIGEFGGPFANPGQPLPAGVVGVLLVERAPPFHVSVVFAHKVLATKPITAPRDEVTFVLTPEEVTRHFAAVRLCVADAVTGEPLKGRVGLYDRQTGGPGVALDAEGCAVLERTPPGIKTLTIRAGTYENVAMFVRIPDGGPVDLGTFRLHPAAVISGSVTGPDDAPVGATLVVRNLDRMGFPQPLSVGHQTPVDADGTFRVPSAGRGRYLLVAQAEGLATIARIVETGAGETDVGRLTFARGTEIHLATEHDGVRDYVATMRDAAGAIHFARTIRGTWPLSLRLEPGKYTIELAQDGTVQRTVPLDVGAKSEVVALGLPDR